MGKNTITSSTIYTPQVFEEFANFYLKHNKAMKVIYVCSAIILVSSIIMFCLGSIFEGIIYTLCGIVFACYGLIVKAIMRKNNKASYNNVDNYEFCDKEMSVKTFNSKGDQIFALTVGYPTMYSVEKQNDVAYLFFNKASAFIVKRENFENQSDFDKVVDNIKSQIVKK